MVTHDLVLDESQRAAGIVPAEEAWSCRRDVVSDFIPTSADILVCGFTVFSNAVLLEYFYGFED